MILKKQSHREKLVIRIVKKKLTSLNERFFRTIQGKKTISSNSGNNLKATNNSELIKPKGLLIYNPKKTIICEAQAKKLNLFPELIKTGEQKSCSSEKERKVNALALRADEGRDNLR